MTSTMTAPPTETVAPFGHQGLQNDNRENTTPTPPTSIQSKNVNEEEYKGILQLLQENIGESGKKATKQSDTDEDSLKEVIKKMKTSLREEAKENVLNKVKTSTTKKTKKTKKESKGDKVTKYKSKTSKCDDKKKMAPKKKNQEKTTPPENAKTMGKVKTFEKAKWNDNKGNDLQQNDSVLLNPDFLDGLNKLYDSDRKLFETFGKHKIEGLHGKYCDN